MSDSEEKEFNCEDHCKMTKEIKNSSFCTKKSKIIDGKIFFGCMSSLRQEPKDVQQFYKCLLWDMGLEDSCKTCMLSCVNNKNVKIKESLQKKKKLRKLMKQLEPNMVLYGITASDVEKISEQYAKSSNSEISDEAIKAADMAQKALYSALNGGSIDISYLNIYAQHSSRKIKKMVAQKNRPKKRKKKG